MDTIVQGHLHTNLFTGRSRVSAPGVSLRVQGLHMQVLLHAGTGGLHMGSIVPDFHVLRCIYIFFNIIN